MRDRETLGHLGGRIRLLREQRGLSQEKLAERAGLTSKFVGEVERLETNPSTTSIARLASALSVNVGDLFEAGDHLLPVPATQLDQVQESYRTLGLAIEGLRSPDAATERRHTASARHHWRHDTRSASASDNPTYRLTGRTKGARQRASA